MTAAPMPTLKLPSGETIAALGQGTWHMAEDPTRHEEEIAALRLGLELDMTVIDTAELYADGAAEQLVGEALVGRRDQAFLVSKVMPSHATYRGTIAACEGSLRRLRTDRLDMYLLHWRGSVPLEETLRAFGELTRRGAIRYWGVSNFDIEDMVELVTLTAGTDVQTDQILYNLARRGPEYDLIPWCRENGIPMMAYSPIEQGRLLRHPAVQGIAARLGVTAAQVALAWVLRQDLLNAVPKAGSRAHVQEDRAALAVKLTEADLRALDVAFPPPLSPQPLGML